MKELEKKYNTLKDKIMEEIEKEHITPHSKIFFFLKTAVMVSSAVIFLFFILYVVSFLLFALSKSGILLLSPFGFFGIMTILNDLPWKIVFLALVSTLGLLLLTKNAFSIYRVPLLYLFLGVIGFVGVTGLIVAKTDLHSTVLRGLRGAPPFGGRDFPERYTRPEMHRISVGRLVSSSTGAMFLIVKEDGRMLEIRTDRGTQFIGREDIQTGDEVLIFGDTQDTFVHAKAIREIKENERGFMRR